MNKKTEKQLLSKIATLEDANGYLHNLREIFVLRHIFDEAKDCGFRRFEVGISMQGQSIKIKVYYELDGEKVFRLFDDINELELYFFGSNKLEDEKLL